MTLNIGEEQATKKIMHYCAYQERSHQEARDKLYSFGLHRPEVENIISHLIEHDYLNEERYAIAYAGGKFRMKQWGREKIKAELRQRGVSSYCIKKGLASIDEDDYTKTLNKLLRDKLKHLDPKEHILSRKRRLYAYLVQKGFENDRVNGLLHKI